ncbi:hypothetical protein [Methylomonas koyamae]|uniref:hypothetical protein n=1 Tax=Methylomonas koyamae TaxID=702114 RepID=UPI00112CF2E8|nr:hypothetical protein [Methylomonas koyamae]
MNETIAPAGITGAIEHQANLHRSGVMSRMVGAGHARDQALNDIEGGWLKKYWPGFAVLYWSPPYGAVTIRAAGLHDY